MAIIENKTAKSIKNNGELLLTISRERIWDEFKKSWVQSKDFIDYLGYLKSFELYKYIFPGANINTKFIDSKDFVVVVANLFKLETPDGLERRLVQEYKIESETSSKVIFLLRFLKLTPETAFDLYKSKLQCHITDSTILEWIKVLGINDNVKIKFVEYKPTTSAEELMSQGFKGRDLGIKIKEIETEKFKQML